MHVVPNGISFQRHITLYQIAGILLCARLIDLTELASKKKSDRPSIIVRLMLAPT